MNFSTVLVPCVIASLVTIGHLSVASQAPKAPHTARALTDTVSTLTDAVRPATPIVVREMVITGTVSRGSSSHTAAMPSRAKIWTCGAIEANLVGGSQRTCEWR
jgi:hypothetical protein